MDSFDLIIRGGTIVDGTGGAPYVGDVGVRDGRIAAVGRIDGSAGEEIHAAGRIVTPGFVDVHTHYDGQVTWENRLAPSSDHGVTTVVMGNCGVGFAPARPGQREMMIKLMEGVEDIPGVVMAEGLPWNWESFPDYLDALAQRHSDIDFCAQIPHSPLRVYVMGERGANQEPPTEADLAEMRRLVAEAIKAGAIGVSTSRTMAHRFRDGRPAPSVKTEEDELLALAGGLRDAGKGVFQLVPNTDNKAKDEFALMRRIAETAERPLSFTLILGGQHGDWRDYIEGLREANAADLRMRGQAIPRAVGFLFGIDLSYHPFSLNPSYRAIADLPLSEKVALMRDPDFRARLIAEEPEDSNPFILWLVKQSHMLFALGDPPNYAPRPEDSFAARAAAEGRDERELIYDELLRNEGRAIIYVPMGNVVAGKFDSARDVVKEDNVILGLGDGGAHYGMICDASFPTYFLTKCVRDAAPGDRIELPHAIRMLAHDTAAAVGLGDRGLLAVGYKADINVIDLDALTLHAPRTKRDLPANGRRLSQKADGYAVTIVSGVVTYRNGEATGALPGRLVRGARELEAA